MIILPEQIWKEVGVKHYWGNQLAHFSIPLCSVHKIILCVIQEWFTMYYMQWTSQSVLILDNTALVLHRINLGEYVICVCEYAALCMHPKEWSNHLGLKILLNI